jgi:hypothetical protein
MCRKTPNKLDNRARDVELVRSPELLTLSKLDNRARDVELTRCLFVLTVFVFVCAELPAQSWLNNRASDVKPALCWLIAFTNTSSKFNARAREVELARRIKAKKAPKRFNARAREVEPF